MKRWIWTALLAVASLMLVCGAHAESLTVYTAVEAEDLKTYAAEFNKVHPDIEIKWVRDSTGIVTAKLLAEKENPQADAIWGLAATSLLLMKKEGMLKPYKPVGVEGLSAPVSLGWKDGTLRVRAGGYAFDATLDNDGRYSFTERPIE